MHQAAVRLSPRPRWQNRRRVRRRASGRSVVYNLRYPGQYYDSETGLSYNYFIDYDAQVGRYVESDPIGLESGVNTYAYAMGQPTMLIDSYGLDAGVGTLPWPGAGARNGARSICALFPEACAVGAAGVVGAAIGTLIYPTIASPLGRVIDSVCRATDHSAECDKQLNRDISTCRAIGRAERAGKRPPGAGSRCYASANQRYANCLAGREPGPLDTWNN
jgi:RHS repeat-associated protein